MTRRPTSDRPLHRAEPRRLAWARPTSSRTAALTAIVGATALGGAVVAAGALVGSDAGAPSAQGEAGTSYVPVSLHGAPPGTAGTRATSTSRSGAARDQADTAHPAADDQSSASGPPRLSLPHVPLTGPSVSLTPGLEVSGSGPSPAGGSGGGALGPSSSDGSSGSSGGSNGHSPGGDGSDDGDETTPPPSVPVPPAPELPTPSLPSASTSTSLEP